MKSVKLLLSFFTLSLLFFSCGNDKPVHSEYGPVFDNVMRGHPGSFRGFDLGEKMDSVMAREDSEPTEVDDYYLYYEYRLKDSSGTFDITYDFDESGLNEIHSDIYINAASQADTVFSSFKSYFDKTYGNSENHGGFNVWTVRSDTYGQVRINLSDGSGDLSPEGAPGKISLWIYPEKE